jgi:hypothetical protein
MKVSLLGISEYFITRWPFYHGPLPEKMPGDAMAFARFIGAVLGDSREGYLIYCAV